MRLVFAGSPEISAVSLNIIAPHFDVCCVLTNTDKPAGRGQKIRQAPLALAASKLGLPVIKADRAGEDVAEKIRGFAPDLLTVVAYGHIFSPSFIAMFPEGGINLHPSLLPLYRGPSPITAAILKGDRETGVTVQRLAKKMDTGDIIGQITAPLDGTETTGTLTGRLGVIGGDLLFQTLKKMSAGPISGFPQDEKKASYCGLIRKTDGIIDWSQPARHIERAIRAYSPWPKAKTTFKGAKLFILNASVAGAWEAQPYPSAPGSVIGIDKTGGILIQTSDGLLLAKELQMEAKNPLTWRSFLNGHPDLIGSVLGVPA